MRTTIAHMSPFASLSGTDVGLYVAVATAIPVLLVVFAVAINDLVGKTIGPRVRHAFRDLFARYSDGLVKARPQSRGSPGTIVILLGSIVAAFRLYTMPSYWKSNLYVTLLMLVFAAAVVMPCLGEYQALHALYTDHASSTTKGLAFVGALTSLVLVIAPVTYTTLKVFYSLLVPPIADDGVSREVEPTRETPDH
jgi:hypothetical protein